MLPAEECIEQYKSAAANHDTAAAMDALAQLDLIEPDDATWAAIRAFCDGRRMSARLELITRRYLAGQGSRSATAHVWLAQRLAACGDKDDAKLVLRDCLANAAPSDGQIHAIADCLLDIGAFTDCLEVVRRQLERHPQSFAWGALECRSLWRLGEKKLVAKKLKALAPAVGTEFALATWYAALGLEFESAPAIRFGVNHLLALLKAGQGHLTRHICSLLVSVGCRTELKGLIDQSDPSLISNLQDLEVIFNEALSAGAYGSAERFGIRILQLDDSAYVKAKLQVIKAHGWIDRLKRSSSGCGHQTSDRRPEFCESSAQSTLGAQ